jgi:hypothetical protein
MVTTNGSEYGGGDIRQNAGDDQDTLFYSNSENGHESLEGD